MNDATSLYRRANHLFRDRRVDLVLLSLAIAFAWVTLLYPLGRDQGLYYYVGREWALRGSVPYRDVLDHKTPGIYIVHALLVLVFGERVWPIRLAEIVCVLVLGVGAARLGSSTRLPCRGLTGLSVFATSIFYFGFLNFHETGEGEIWLAMFVVWAAVFALGRHGSVARSALLSGLCMGGALLMKPSALPFALPVGGALAFGAVRESGYWSRLFRKAVAFAGGIGIVWAITLGYFVAVGAMADLVDIVVRANRHYVTHETAARSLGDIASFTRWYFQWFAPFSPLGVVALLFLGEQARRQFVANRRDRRGLLRIAMGLAFLFAGWASVVMQGKFFLGHWGVMIGPLAVCAAQLFDVLLGWLRRWRYPLSRVARAALLAIAMVTLYVSSGEAFNRYWSVNVEGVRLLSGATSRLDFLSTLVELFRGGSAADNERVAIWIAEHSSPSDQIAVRGFQPQIYASAKRHYGGRFFWTTFIVAESRAYNREKWLAEDKAAIAKSPPRYVVAVAGVEGNTDGADWWQRIGYVQRVEIGDFVVLERPEVPTGSAP